MWGEATVRCGGAGRARDFLGEAGGPFPLGGGRRRHGHHERARSTTLVSGRGSGVAEVAPWSCVAIWVREERAMMTHRYATRTLLSVLLLSVVGCAPAPPSKLELASSTPSFVGTLVRIDSPEKGLLRVAQRTENPSWSFLALPFRLSEVPKAATLDIVATGVDSACPLTGQPQGSTTLS